MASLYQIQEDLYRLFDTIEENDGEITDEQYDFLCIKQEELKTKLDSYYKATQIWKNDAETCKAEKKRINDVQKRYENRVERLKKAMLDAVLQFGEQGKTNKYIELSTAKLFTRSAKSVVVDEDRIKILLSEFERYIRELENQGILYTGEDVDLQGILDCINTNCKAEHGEDFEPFTLTDLTTIKLSITRTSTIYELFRNGRDAIQLYTNDPINTSINDETMKDDWKTAIEVSATSNTSMPSIAAIVTNQTLQIK